eukprot:31529-Pelagococcus_subviridis.AAC.15
MPSTPKGKPPGGGALPSSYESPPARCVARRRARISRDSKISFPSSPPRTNAIRASSAPTPSPSLARLLPSSLAATRRVNGV